MIPSLFKMMALTGSAVIGGGTIVNQVFFSEGKEPKIKSRDISSNSLTTSELGCVIYEAKEPSGSWGRRKFTQLEKKFKSMEEFFKELDKKKVWNDQTLRKEIKGGCSKYGKVFVWQGVPQGNNKIYGKTWIYAGDMNNGKDWTDDAEVKRNSSNILQG
ncbi:hypothetical protein MHF_1107 [Mycoplasma haemofelis Ohio2]|uniref:Uncharacterized protein n=1 Tax=Mycoplasma haemofelis (strain Ohio2) TaxID=859194 RepID=F6FJJ9_MYCHI|nr:hypothetical protein MHF_1107 [Mycoplasma haemofelis Ohio2]